MADSIMAERYAAAIDARIAWAAAAREQAYNCAVQGKYTPALLLLGHNAMMLEFGEEIWRLWAGVEKFAEAPR